MGNGWIKLYRQIQDCWIWAEKEPFDKRSAWIDLLLSANHRDKKMLFNGKLITIRRGQYLTSMRKLSERWKWSINRTYRFMKLLEDDKMIHRKSDKDRTLITVENYSNFQDCENTNGYSDGYSDEYISGTPTDTVTEHKQEYKNIKNDKNINLSKKRTEKEAQELFANLWKLYPNKKGKDKVSVKTKLKLLEIGFDEMSRAIERYKVELGKDDWRKLQYGSTFFNSGYVDYLDNNYVPSEDNKKLQSGFNRMMKQNYDFEAIAEALKRK